MKYLIILVLVLLILWQWRNARDKQVKTGAERDARPPHPVDMVACAHCGVHLPKSEVVHGNAGSYCNSLHRTAAER